MSTSSHGNTWILTDYAQKSLKWTLIWADDVKASGGQPHTNH